LSRPRILHGRLGDATAFATRSRHAGAWDEDTRTRYLDDVRARAEEMAKTILAEAMAEAQKIREQAQAQGLEEGRAEAEATRQEELARLAALTTALHAELRAHAQEESTRRETLLRRLLILAVEKATGLVLQTERKDALWRLFSEAQAKLLDEGTVTIFVHPEDAPLMEELLAQSELSQEGRSMRVRTDAAISQGGVRIESSSTVVDNTVDERLRQVLDILEQLTGHD
jgi:flagellar assembly protein FliH